MAQADLDALVEEAAAQLGAGTFCSITVRRRGTSVQVASNDPRAAACDQIEVIAGDGPCLLAMAQLSSVFLPDLQAEERWPEWRRAALGSGFASMLALPAFVDDDTTVAVNVYREDTTWSTERVLGLDVYAQQAAVRLRRELDPGVG